MNKRTDSKAKHLKSETSSHQSLFGLEFVPMAIITITTLAGILAVMQPYLEHKHRKAKTWVSAGLVILLIISGALQFDQQRKTEKALMGDPDNPPYFDVNDFGENGGQADGVIINRSDYPAYAVTATMSWLNNRRATPMSPTNPVTYLRRACLGFSVRNSLKMIQRRLVRLITKFQFLPETEESWSNSC